MSVLLVRLAGPMQSWGEYSRYNSRDTAKQPTKSGILGLLAAAQGRRRTDAIEDLVRLRFGVRTDQPGRVLKDFQTAHELDSDKSMPLTDRFYLSDAVFVAGVEGEPGIISDLENALRSPRFALYLGRRAFVPTKDLTIGTMDVPLQQALTDHQWEASDWFRNRFRSKPYFANITVDAEGWTPLEGDAEERIQEERICDVPISWDIEHREYGWRKVRRYQVPMRPMGTAASTNHDPMGAL